MNQNSSSVHKNSSKYNFRQNLVHKLYSKAIVRTQRQELLNKNASEVTSIKDTLKMSKKIEVLKYSQKKQISR